MSQSPDVRGSQERIQSDLFTLGKQIRHRRKLAGHTLETLGALVSVQSSQLSQIENGKKEPKLSLLLTLAEVLDVELSDLLSSDAPTARDSLEIQLQRNQRSTLYQSLGLPNVATGKSLPDDALVALVGLHNELRRRVKEFMSTPEEARRANTELRQVMRTRNNYLPEIEQEAQKILAAVEHSSGALTHYTVNTMAKHLGFTLVYVNDLPHAARSVTDIENGRIYLPPASIPGGHGLRAMALQAMAHRILDHQPPTDYADFLRQRLEINYFAAACLMPQAQSVAFLAEAKRERNIAIEDFRDAFGVTHEAAALRFTNLATEHLDMPVHFMRVGDSGAIYNTYENDGLPIPTDITGSVEGQQVCRKWAARTTFERQNRTTEFYQYTDTPAGTFWSTSQTGHTNQGEFSISFGVRFDDAKWFRGRDTKNREVSRCPDPSCCNTPSTKLASRWEGKAWPSARLEPHIFFPMPVGVFPGVDTVGVYEFLDQHTTTPTG